jgi:hypothetical protein
MPAGEACLPQDRAIVIDPVRSSGPDDLELEIAQPKAVTDPEIAVSQCLQKHFHLHLAHLLFAF